MAKLILMIRDRWTVRSLRGELNWLGLDVPGALSAMAFDEPAEYVARAILAVNTRGE